ncbi:MAG: LysM peptidoglycan-binding domain-containing protein [Armatimonadota bacterium]|nr:LysM peptidoglycan-binding domain-containing protein [Armatimonadota bacterium]
MRVLVCTALLVVLGTGAASASTLTHIVQPGETLWAIASAHGTTVEAIARQNDLRGVDLLQPGQRLVIPAPQSRVAASATVSYRVRPGDTLWSLARRYQTSVQELAVLNRLPLDGTLRVGQVLRLKAPPRLAPTSASAAAPRRLVVPPYRGVSWARGLIGLARRFLGTRYRWGATGPRAFDCSGFLQYVYARAGVVLPRTTEAMYQAGKAVPPGQLLPGDMVFFTTYRPGPSHAGIYLGEGLFIHASSGYGSVTVTPLVKEYYRKRYLGARRF